MIILRQRSGPDGGEIELSFLISWPNIETNVDKLTKRMRYFFQSSGTVPHRGPTLPQPAWSNHLPPHPSTSRTVWPQLHLTGLFLWPVDAKI